MRRSMNGTRSASNANGGSGVSGKQGGGGSVTRRATATDENQAQGDKSGGGKSDDNLLGMMSGPVTARLKLLEKKFAQVLEMQAKFNILDKWIQQQFGVKMFPAAVVNSEKFPEGNPEDVDNPFYAVYLVIQRLSFLEEKVKKLEARPLEEFPEPKPTSNYSSAHAFRNFKTGKGAGTGGVKRGYVSSSPSTPKKAKMIARPVAPSPNYPFKPSVKILPRDPNIPSPVKKDKEQDQHKESSQTKQSEDPNANKSDAIKDIATSEKDKPSESKGSETISKNTETVETDKDEIKQEEPDTEKMDTETVVESQQENNTPIIINNTDDR